MKTRNSSVEEFMQSPETHLIFETVDNDFHLHPKYSELELLVQKDMIRYGLTYPFVSVDDVKAYWNPLLS